MKLPAIITIGLLTVFRMAFATDKETHGRFVEPTHTKVQMAASPKRQAPAVSGIESHGLLGHEIGNG